MVLHICALLIAAIRLAILPTWADWVAGRDPVLEWIAKQ
jgi:hypothetical protein